MSTRGYVETLHQLSIKNEGLNEAIVKNSENESLVVVRKLNLLACNLVQGFLDIQRTVPFQAIYLKSIWYPLENGF